MKTTDRYKFTFILVTSLFFLWGFARSVLDVLNKHFQETLNVSIAHSMLIQASTYAAYALTAIPAGILITRYGYRYGIVGGLLLFAAGSFLFIPAAQVGTFGLFLAALFVIGCGLAFLETSANPYISRLGPPRSAASRLNISQAFNGLGCILGPITVGSFLFTVKGAKIDIPYSIMGVVVLALAFVFCKVRLPELGNDGNPESLAKEREEEGGFGVSCRRLWRNRTFIAGFITLFCYEMAEIGINSIFINYATSDGWLDKVSATAILSIGALGLFMLARVVGGAIMSKVSPVKVLLVCGIGAMAGSLLITFSGNMLGHAGIFACYAFEAIMFPTVFAITISAAGEDAKTASAFMMMTPLGGAMGAWLMGNAASLVSSSSAFFIPAIGYAVVVIYAFYRLGVNRRLKNRQNYEI